jgi:ferredoxin
MSKVEVDFGLCESNGVCMGIIPEVFDLDDQDYLHILQDEVTPENEQQIREEELEEGQVTQFRRVAGGRVLACIWDRRTPRSDCRRTGAVG